jgi:hypothetical protein
MGEQLTDDQLQQLQDEQDAAAAAAAQQPVQVAQPSQGAAVPAIDANAPLYAQVAQQDAQKQALEAANANPQVAIAPPKPAEAQAPTVTPVVLPSAPAASPKPTATAAPVAPGATAVHPLAIAMRQAPVATPRQFTAVSLPSTAEQTRAQIPGQTSTPGAAPGETASTGIAQPSSLAMPTISRPPALDTPSQAVSLGTDKDDDPLAAKTEKDQAEQARLQKSGSGISQIFKPVNNEGNPDANKHPGFWKKVGGVAAKIGDIAGTTFFPSVMAQIPGTELHHRVLMNEQNRRVGIDLAQQKAQQDLDTQDQADDIAAQNATKVPVTNPVTGQTYFIPQKDVAKFLGTAVTTQGHIKTAADRAEERLGEAGLKHDDDGNIVPVDDDKLPPKLKADAAYKQVKADLMSSQQELADAKTETEKAKNDPNSPAYQLAVRKLAVAQQNATAAGIRANAYALNSTVGAFGTDTHGTALAGAMITDDGQTVGSHFQQNVRPTGQERGKADLANSAHEQLQDLKSIVAKRPDVFGPASGRKTDFRVWFGSQDPDAQRFRAARTIAGDHLAGVFGGRSEAALTALDAAIGHFKDNPAAITAGLDQLDKANNSFVKAGTVHTVGSTASRAARTGSRQPSTQPPPRPTGAAAVQKFSDGKRYYVDAKGARIGPAE